MARNLPRLTFVVLSGFACLALAAGQEPNRSKSAEVGIDAVLTDYPIDMQRQFRRASP